MDIVLIPMSWIDNEFPDIKIILMNKSILLRLTKVYDGLESAGAHILDLLTIEHQKIYLMKQHIVESKIKRLLLFI